MLLVQEYLTTVNIPNKICFLKRFIILMKIYISLIRMESKMFYHRDSKKELSSLGKNNLFFNFFFGLHNLKKN